MQHEKAMIISCSFTPGYPVPSVKWYKDKNRLRTQRGNKYYTVRKDTTVSTLVLFNFDSTDEGIYSCVIRNRLGEAKEEIKLTGTMTYICFILWINSGTMLI